MPDNFFNDIDSLFGQPVEKKRDFVAEEKRVRDNPDAKKTITIRLDRDVLAYFKAEGEGYQTRINEVLKNYINENSKRRRVRVSPKTTPE